MTLTFICTKCRKRRFFQNFVLIKGRKICVACGNAIREQEEINKKQEEERTRQIDPKVSEKRKQEKEKKANELLRKQLEQERRNEIEKQKKFLLHKAKKLSRSREERITIKSRNVIYFSLEQEAKKLSRIHDKVLYVYADVKNIKAIEWVKGKNRVALNKERELRRTHKGGFSQEKFQHFIDMKKKQTKQWVEDNLLQKGVLRPPYDKIIVDTHDPILGKKIKEIIDKL